MDENNPIGAVCLEHGVVPEGHKGPLHDRWARRFSRRTFVNRVRWWTRPTGPAGQLSARRHPRRMRSPLDLRIAYASGDVARETSPRPSRRTRG